MEYFDPDRALTHVSNIQEFIDMNEFLQDDFYLPALDLAMNCIAKPNIPVATARKALLQMQACSMYYKNLANTYMTIRQGKAGTDENKKKNVYMSMAAECHEMAQTLKYIAKDASQL